MEMRLQVTTRWLPTDSNYVSVMAAVGERTYRTALDVLERLVVQGLFELTKLNLMSTGEFHVRLLLFYHLTSDAGYKMRTHIAKALQTRSRAIRNALERYNIAAAKLHLPREILTYGTIIEYSFIGDFSLLKTSREDIRLQEWARPAVREAMIKYFQLECAHEEIIRLNVEMCHLHTAIRDEGEEVAACIMKLAGSNDPSDVLLAEELRCRWELRSHVNALHVKQLCEIESTFGFSGTPGPGVRQGCSRDGMMEGVATASKDDVVEELSNEPGEQEAEDELISGFERLSVLVTELD
jgi:hypothetical protein